MELKSVEHWHEVRGFEEPVLLQTSQDIEALGEYFFVAKKYQYVLAYIDNGEYIRAYGLTSIFSGTEVKKLRKKW